MRGFTAGVEDVRTVVDRDERYSRRPNRIQSGRSTRSTQRRSETSSIERPGLIGSVGSVYRCDRTMACGRSRKDFQPTLSAIGIGPLSSGLPLEEVEEADPYFAQSQG